MKIEEKPEKLQILYFAKLVLDYVIAWNFKEWANQLEKEVTQLVSQSVNWTEK